MVNGSDMKLMSLQHNTLPAISNANKTEAYVEGLILAGITNEIMSSEM